jgi:hypothetical protein
VARPHKRKGAPPRCPFYSALILGPPSAARLLAREDRDGERKRVAEATTKAGYFFFAFFAGFLATFFAGFFAAAFFTAFLANVVLLSVHEPNRLRRSLVLLAR